MKTFLRFAALAVALVSPAAYAQLHLTAAGTGFGFTLSLFVDQVTASGFCCGPLGIATNSFGQVVLQDYPNGRNYVFNDVDNQHFSASLSSAPFATFSYGAAITNSGGTLYATNNDAGQIIYRLNPDGSINSPLTGTGIGGHGIATNFATGHLVAANGSVIRDVNQVTGTSTIIVSGVDVDGVSVSADGSIVYGATGGHVLGWNYSGTQVFDSGALGSPDGTGVIQGANLFSGQIVSNDNDGNVFLLNPTTHVNTLIATGGSRGDYVGLDGNNGTLFLTQTDSVYRLGCGPSCFFTPPIPEPETYALMLAGLACLGVIGRRRRRR
jgi:PEP-CTERM motif